MNKRYGKILAIVLALCMIFSAQSAVFADEISHTLQSGDGFKIQDAAGNVIKGATIELLQEGTNEVLATTVCQNGESFTMTGIPNAQVAGIRVSKSGYTTSGVLRRSPLVKNSFYNKASAVAVTWSAPITLESDPAGIHTLTGKVNVLDSATGETIRNAVFLLADRTDTSVIKYEAAIANDGTFQINNIIPGSYSWGVSAEGYDTSSFLTSSMGSLANPTAQNRNLGTQRVTLTKSTTGTATISGTVADQDGSAISGVSVQLKAGTKNAGSAVITDANGAYTITKVEAGTYTLQASANGYETADTEAFTIAEGDVITGKNIQLEKEVKAVISGKVTDSEGQPIAGYVSVGLYQNGRALAVTSANADGEYTIGSKGWGYTPGEYEIHIGSSGYIGQVIAVTVPKQENFTVDTAALQIDPIKDASISGVLRDADGQPITGMIGWYKDGVYVGGRSVAGTGEYKITGLRAGSYTVIATSTGYSSAQIVDFVIEDKTYEQEFTGNDLYLGAADMTTAILSGTITAEDRTADTVITAALIRDGQEVAAVQCDADGKYVFKDVQPGDYTVTASADGYIDSTTGTITLKSGASLGANNLNIYKKIVLEQIKVTKLPDKVTYEEGELLDTTGMEVTAYYSDGTSKAITNYDISGYGLKIGKNVITITYSEDGVQQEASFAVTVKSAASDENGEAPDENGKAPGNTGNGGSDGNAGNAGNNGTDQNGSQDNHADKTAQTGDNSNMGVLWLLLLAAAAVLAVMTTRKEKRDVK